VWDLLSPVAFYADSFRVSFVYNRFSKPINRRLTEAAKAREPLDDARTLQDAWDRTLLMRVPVLAVSMIAQCVALVWTLA
jgi:hypothetical protein